MNNEDAGPGRPDGEPGFFGPGQLGREKPLRAPETSGIFPPDAPGVESHAVAPPETGSPSAEPTPPELSLRFDRYPMRYDVESPSA